MNELKFNFDCLDGTYRLIAKIDKTTEYQVDTSIAGLTSKTGTLDEAKTNELLKYLNDAQIPKWDKEYLGSGIEDACRWHVEIIMDNKKYGSTGLESYEPYNYEYLIKAIGLIEENYKYFLVNI